MAMKQTCILVLGMHRSGTSALTGVLQLLDIYLGSELLDPQNDNKKGFYENKNLVQIHEKILEEIGSYWHDVFYRPEQLENISKTTVDELKNTIKNEFFNTEIFAIKDPRLALLFPLYERVLQELSIEIKIIIPYRHPIEISKSLYKRDRFSQNKSLLLWAYSFLLAEKYSREYDRAFVSFDDLITKTDLTIKNISEQLHVDLFFCYQQNKNRVDEFLEPSLKHHNIKKEQTSVDIPKVVQDILITKFDPNMSVKFDQLLEEIFSYQQLFYHHEVTENKALLQVLNIALRDHKNRLHQQEKKIKQQGQIFQRQKQERERLEQIRRKQTQKLEHMTRFASRKDREIAQLRKQLIEEVDKLEVLQKVFQKEHNLLVEQKVLQQEFEQIKIKLQNTEKELEYFHESDRKRVKELDKLGKKHDALKKELTLIYTSRSWRLTRPIRKILRLFR